MFYRDAHFYSVSDIATIVRQVGFDEVQFCQTLVGIPSNRTTMHPVRAEYGDGAFVVISATKTNQSPGEKL